MTRLQLRHATAELSRADPRLAGIIREVELEALEPSDPWWELVDSIVSQQLSLKAAATILARLEALYPTRPTPAEILRTDHEALRSVGLSNAKAVYIRDLAQRVSDGTIRLDALTELADEEVAAELTAVKGIGRWTAEMYLIFHLGRPDVLPVGDLGLQEAVRRTYDLPARPSPGELTELGERWRPYRSVATRLLWKSLTLETPTDPRARPALADRTPESL